MKNFSILALVTLLSTCQHFAMAANPAISADLLNPNGTLAVNYSQSGSLDISGYRVLLDPVLGPVFVPLDNPVLADDQQLAPDNEVRAVAVDGNIVYVGGSFTDAGGNPDADYLARWDGSQWTAVGAAPDNAVQKIRLEGEDLFVRGAFDHIGGQPVDGLAIWDGSEWRKVDNMPEEESGAEVLTCPTSSDVTLTVDGEAWPENICIPETVELGASFASGTGFTGTPTYSWNSTSAGRIQFLPGVNTSTAANPLALVGNAGAVTISVTITDGSCTVTKSEPITVASQLSPTIAIPASFNLCKDAQITLSGNLAGGTAPVTYSWSASSTNGATASFSATTTTLSPVLTANNPGTLTVTLTATDSRSCQGQSDPMTFTIAQPIVASISNGATANVCAGTNLPLGVTTSGGFGTLSYQWELVSVSISSGVASLSGLLDQTGTGSTSSSPTLVPHANATDGDTYTLRAKVTDAAGCFVFTSNIVVTVRRITSAALAVLTSPATICEGGTASFEVNVSRVLAGTYSYTLVYNQSGNPGNTTVNSYSSGADRTTDAANADYNLSIVSVTDQFGCTTSSLGTAQTVVVNNIPTVGTISGGSPTVCENATPTLSVLEDTYEAGSSQTYQWQASTTSATDGFSDIGSATAASYTSTTLTQDTWFRRVVFSTLNGVTCSKTTPVVKYTVNNITVGSISGGDQTVCVDQNLTVTGDSYEAGSGQTYQWQESTTSAIAGFGDIAGATAATYAVPSDADGKWFRRVVTSTLNSVTCTKVTEAVQVTVNNISEPGVVAADQTICAGDDVAAFTQTTASAGDGTLSYQWQKSTDGGTNWSDIAGATSTTYDEGTLTADAKYRRVVTSTLNTVACTA
ncbi:MAG: hypothetical protein RI973_1334, partial [Bacteroidota bacterium]